MHHTTIQRLNALNRQFYATVADEFDTTRGKPWHGWRRLPPLIRRRQRTSLRVLDAGCGNGRFGAFLASEFSIPITYYGIDSSPALLAHARETLEPLPNIALTLEERDLIDQPHDTGHYDLVVLFGVIHHIPGAENRIRLLQSLAARLAPGGLLAFACWRFYEYERFRAREVAWLDDLEREPGDYLLDWRRGETAIRYCHYVDDAEATVLQATTRLRTLATYRADGSEGDANLYVIQEKRAKP